MHLPWIKAKKVTRISRLVAELQSPSNRSSTSLVVETGFPASLLDLYMKNQDRLSKKSKKKKKKLQQQQQQAEAFDATNIATSAAAGKKEKNKISSAKVSEPVVSDGEQQEEPLVGENFWGPTVSIIENCACPGEEIGGKKYDDGCERSRDGGAVVGSVMKVFVVVVLALWMKELTVGITMSAFVLFFLDYVGRRYGSSMWTILDFCGCSIQRIYLTPVIWIKERIIIQIERRESFDQGDGTLSIAGSSFNSSEDVNFLAAREIEVVESSNLSSVCEITQNLDCSLSNFDLSTHRTRRGSEEELVVAEEIRDGVEALEHKDDSGSRKKKKLRSKIIKKIVPKKLRKNKGNKSKENGSEIKGEALCNVGGGSSTSAIDEEQEEKTGEGREVECLALTTLQNLLDLEDEADCEDENGKLCRYDELIMAGNANGNALVVRRKSDTETKSTETITKSAETISTELKRTERRSNSSYLMLVPIALLGLLSSRGIAFLLIIIWCLALAFIRLVRRTKYVPRTLK